MVYNESIKYYVPKMKYKFCKPLLLITLFSVSVNAQNFDASFLESLPEEVAFDLINRSNEKTAQEDTQYRRPSTYIKKPDTESQRFGAQVFSMMQSSLMPINESNFDGSYQLDFGDELELQMVGQKSSITKLYINRDGSVNIADIGKVFLSGLSLEDASNLIKAKVSESFIGVESYITLINVRDIQIIMAGNVYNPGPYTLNGNSNIFHALSVAGGPSEGGSFRSIDLIRNNKIIESVDLYQTFIFAQSSFKTRLRSGDIVFVNPVNNIVTITGAFKRPGQYELTDDENLYDSLIFANGVNKFADLNNIVLERILNGSITPLSIAGMNELKKILANDGDKIFIRSFPFRSVVISGAVKNPGAYLMNEGQSIKDVLIKAKGFSENAYPFGAIYENLQTAEINRQAKESLYKDFLDNLLSVSQIGASSSEGELASIIDITMQLKNSPVSGRVIIDILSQDLKDSQLIKNGDKIHIPEIPNQVYIYGEVSYEGAALFNDGQDITYYINKKGGLSENADKKSVYILQPNGETDRLKLNRNIFVNQGKEVKIYPGSIIFIPRKIDSDYSSRLKAQAYLSILSSLGVSLASIAVLKD